MNENKKPLPKEYTCPYCTNTHSVDFDNKSKCPICNNEVLVAYLPDENENLIYPTILFESQNFEIKWYGPQATPKGCPDKLVRVFNHDVFSRYLNNKARQILLLKEANWIKQIKHDLIKEMAYNYDKFVVEFKRKSTENK